MAEIPAEIMHFDIIKFKTFLGDAPLTTYKIHILINFDPKKDLKFGIFSTLIVEFFTQSTPQMNVHLQI